MSDHRNQLDKAMDDIKEDMIKDIINVTSKLDKQELNQKSLDILELSS